MPPAVGVPVTAPAELMLNPGGRPVAVKFVGELLAVMVNVGMAVPTVPESRKIAGQRWCGIGRVGTRKSEDLEIPERIAEVRIANFAQSTRT